MLRKLRMHYGLQAMQTKLISSRAQHVDQIITRCIVGDPTQTIVRKK